MSTCKQSSLERFIPSIASRVDPAAFPLSIIEVGMRVALASYTTLGTSCCYKAERQMKCGAVLGRNPSIRADNIVT